MINIKTDGKIGTDNGVFKVKINCKRTQAIKLWKPAGRNVVNMMNKLLNKSSCYHGSYISEMNDR